MGLVYSVIFTTATMAVHKGGRAADSLALLAQLLISVWSLERYVLLCPCTLVMKFGLAGLD